MVAPVVKDWVTEKDGVSFCPVRLAFMVGAIGYFFFTLHDMLSKGDFTFMEHAKDWISGLAQYLGLGGAAIAGKNYTEKAD